MKKVLIVLIWLIPCLSQTQVFDMVISKTLPGAYRSVKSAVNRIPSGSEEKYYIFITNGFYEEKIDFGSNYTNVCLIGESKEGVVLSYDDYNGDGTHSTSNSYTIWFANHDFYCSNLSVVNSAGDVGQAVAIRTTGDRQAFNNCLFSGFQDTYYAQSGMQYHRNCSIQGNTDFIFGDATAVFDSCNILCLPGGQYITAPADSKFTTTRKDGSTQIHGLLFTDCNIDAADNVSVLSYYLGRPWQQYSSSVYINCTLDKHIKDIGWSTWNDDAHLTSFFAEYGSIDSNGILIDTSLRAEWSYQLADSIKNNYYNLDYFLKKPDTTWNPNPLFSVLEAPENLSVNGTSLSWNVVNNAKGYAIVRNDSVIGFSATTDYSDPTALRSMVNTYKVKSVSQYGNLSVASNEVSIDATGIVGVHPDFIRLRLDYINQGEIQLNLPSDVTIYNVSGVIVSHSFVEQSIDLMNLKKGIYIIKVCNGNYQTITEKIIIY